MESAIGWIGTVLIIIATGMFLCIVTIGLYVVINKKERDIQGKKMFLKHDPPPPPPPLRPKPAKYFDKKM